MLKRISYFILAVAILVAGYVALNKLNYLERSVRIFSIRAQNFDGRGGRGQFGNDGISQRGGRGGFDSVRQQSGRNNRELYERGPSEERMRDGHNRRGGDFRGGQKIYLKNVLWFLAVFASFTVLTFYTDKGLCKLLKKTKKDILQTH